MREPHRRWVALVVGDTAGHTFPALALAEAFLERDPGADIVFLGTRDSVADRLLARAGYQLRPVPARPIRRASPRERAAAVVSVGAAVVSARRTLATHRSRLVVGFGGFASAGVLIAARTLGLGTAIHELNVELGLANAWLRRIVHRMYRGLQDGVAAGVGVGVPVRARIAALADVPRDPPGSVLRVLITSGSRGASFLRRQMPLVLGELARAGTRVEVLHQADDVESLMADYAAAGVPATVSPFFDDMAAAYRWAHLAVARAGANTLAELAAAGLPALIVPLADAAADHQSANARVWSAAGAGLAVAEDPWNPRVVAAWLRSLSTDPTMWHVAAAASRRLARPDAARRLVDDCERLMRDRW